MKANFLSKIFLSMRRDAFSQMKTIDYTYNIDSLCQLSLTEIKPFKSLAENRVMIFPSLSTLSEHTKYIH